MLDLNAPPDGLTWAEYIELVFGDLERRVKEYDWEFVLSPHQSLMLVKRLGVNRIICDDGFVYRHDMERGWVIDGDQSKSENDNEMP